MENTPEEITETQAEALKVLWDNNGEIVTASEVADFRDTTDRAAEGLLKRMAPELITIDDSGNSNIYTFSDTGRSLAEEMFEDAPYGNSNLRMDVRTSSGEGSKRLHGVTIQARLQNSSMMPDDWYGVLQEKEDVSWISTQENDYQAARDIWVLRFHKDAVTFQLRKDCSIRGTSSSKLIRNLHQKAEKVSSWIEDVAGVDLQCRYFINRAELAFENLPEAQLADDLPGIPLSRFRTIDPDLQEQVFKLDASPGFPEGEAQGRNFERVAQAVENQIEQYSINYDAHDNRIEMENQLHQEGISGQKAVQAIKNVSVVDQKVESLEDQVSSLKSIQEELQATREEEKKTRDALMEQVRSVNNLAQSNQELLQENVPRVQEFVEVVPHQTKLLEKLVDRVQELEEKVVSEDDSSEEYSNRVGLRSPKEETDVEVEGKAEITSIQLKTMREGDGKGSEEKQVSMYEELPDYSVDPSMIEEGLQFRDLREDLLLEVEEVELLEDEESFQDQVSVRVAGTLRTWNSMPRRELARVLGTDRFEFVDVGSEGSEDEEEEEDSVIFQEDKDDGPDDSQAYHFF